MKKIISYHHVEDIFNQILIRIKRLRAQINFTHIYGPPNGGLPISTHFANHLGLKNIVGSQNMLAEFISCNYNDINKMGILIVDDICDTGKTFIDIKEILDVYNVPKVKFASMFLKHRSEFKPDICYEEVSDDSWLIFPWEPTDGADEDRKDYEGRRGLL
jgi:hypoxanthine phosphoribosyltransferase